MREQRQECFLIMFGTRLFFNYVWDKADGILFIRKRLTFYNVKGEPGKNCGGAASCLVAYGKENAKALEISNIDGKYIKL